ncbi:hypothetical protein T484DRAFT_1978775, partial [Baffinella frigidus]
MAFCRGRFWLVSGGVTGRCVWARRPRNRAGITTSRCVPSVYCVWRGARRLMHVCIEHHGLTDDLYDEVRPQCFVVGVCQAPHACV